MKTNTNSFKVLSSRLCEMLETEGYSKTTMKDMKFAFETFTSGLIPKVEVPYED